MAVVFQGFSSVPQIVVGPITADIGECLAGYLKEADLTVPGSQPGMHFIVTAPDLEDNLAIVSAVCATAGTVAIRIMNATVGNIDPASQSFYVIGL